MPRAGSRAPGNKDLCTEERKKVNLNMSLEHERLAEEDEDKKMVVVEIDDEIVFKTCRMNNYKYAVITPNDIVIPPKK